MFTVILAAVDAFGQYADFNGLYLATFVLDLMLIQVLPLLRKKTD